MVVLEFGPDAAAPDCHRLTRAELDAGHAVRALRAVPDARVSVRDFNVRAGADLRAKAAAVANARIRLLSEGPRNERAARTGIGEGRRSRSVDFAQVTTPGFDVTRNGVDFGFRPDGVCL